MRWGMLERGNLNKLPKDLLLEIGSYLSPEILAKSAGVNRAFRQLAQNNLQWEKKFKRHFPHRAVPISNDTNWYSEFCKAYQTEYQKQYL